MMKSKPNGLVMEFTNDDAQTLRVILDRAMNCWDPKAQPQLVKDMDVAVDAWLNGQSTASVDSEALAGYGGTE